jgi:cobaltochelatase CobN
VAAGAAFRDQVAGADALVHVQDMAEQDVLDADAFAEHEGGFAAAAQALGNAPALYHVDAAREDAPKVRALSEEVARVLRARATNPRWLEGQMRHGYRGASEIAKTVDNLYAYAALTTAVPSRHFDLIFDATLGDEAVRAFLNAQNPDALQAMAQTFANAARRGLWLSRRNSAMTLLRDLLGDPAPLGLAS